MKMKHKDPKFTGYRKSSSKRDVYSKTILPQETRNSLNKPPIFTRKQLEKV